MIFNLGHIKLPFSADLRVTQRTITIRDNTPYKEVIPIKRQWKHPLYNFPQFYYDIAIYELGKKYF